MQNYQLHDYIDSLLQAQDYDIKDYMQPTMHRYTHNTYTRVAPVLHYILKRFSGNECEEITPLFPVYW